jgi:hypothetical protein
MTDLNTRSMGYREQSATALSRRSFIKGSLSLVGAAFPVAAFAAKRLQVRQMSSRAAGTGWGLALVYGEGSLDLIDLDESLLLHSITGLRATHAVTPVEHLNRFVVHGHRMGSHEGALVVIQVDPKKKTWEVLLNTDLSGGPALHWQPNPEHTEIVFNTVRDGGLHVLDTKTLALKRFAGGGNHSNMAFFENMIVATDRMSGATTLRLVDRERGEVKAATAVGRGGHGVTVNRENALAFVWSWDGLHVVSLAKASLGKHLGVLHPSGDERSWFCWTPQGGRYSHDVSWMEGDRYNPYLLVIDMKNRKFERIETGDKDLRPSYLQISPGGRWGLSSIHGSQEIAVFDTVKNVFKGTVSAGVARKQFFERDMAFCRNRSRAVVTNSAENSISLLDLSARQEVRRISLQRTPMWMKVISA